MPLGVPIIVNPDGTVTIVPPAKDGFVAQAQKGAAIVIHVLFSRGMRPYEIAIAAAVLKALEKSFGFHVGF